MLSDPIRVTIQMATVMDELGVPYLVGGSIASSIYGDPRATQDIDMVAALRPAHIDQLVSSLSDAFYVDAQDILEAIERGSSFNVIHLETMTKVDVFVAGTTDMDREEMRRRRQMRLSPNLEYKLSVATPEDVILQKLVWYRKGGSISDRQWRDVLGVIKVQVERLDWDYLELWAKQMMLLDLLHLAMEESGLDRGGDEHGA